MVQVISARMTRPVASALQLVCIMMLWHGSLAAHAETATSISACLPAFGMVHAHDFATPSAWHATSQSTHFDPVDNPGDLHTGTLHRRLVLRGGKKETDSCSHVHSEKALPAKEGKQHTHEHSQWCGCTVRDGVGMEAPVQDPSSPAYEAQPVAQQGEDDVEAAPQGQDEVEVHDGSECEWCGIAPILGMATRARAHTRTLCHRSKSRCAAPGEMWTCSQCAFRSTICGDCYNSVIEGGEYLPAGHAGGVSSNKYGGMIVPQTYLVRLRVEGLVFRV